MNIQHSDARLTAHAFGELDGDEKRLFEAALADSPDAEQELADIERTISALREERGSVAEARLDEQRRAVVERAIEARRRADGGARRTKRRWVVAASSAVALAAGAMLFMTTAQKDSVVAVDLANVAASATAPVSEYANAAPPVAAQGKALAKGEIAERASPYAEGDLPLEGLLGPSHEMQPVEGSPSQGEKYDQFDENPFIWVAKDPRSTFSIDVDTASYALVRRHLIGEHRLPPKGAVRIEELVNYFTYSYPEPTGAEPFSVQADMASTPWAREHRLLRIGIKGRHVAPEQIKGKNLVFLIDVSGSMQPPNKLPLLKRAFELLVRELGARDHVSIVVYAGASGLVLPSTPGTDRATILNALGRLEAGGSTNGGDGIRLAYRQATESFIPGGVNRVILATDGDFNVGVTRTSDLVDLVQHEAKRGVFLSVLGFGEGNFKDSMLEKLADKGNGNYAYIDSFDEAKKVLLEQAASTLVTIAKDVKIQIELNPRAVAAFRLIGYENRVLAHRDFNDDRKDAGEIGSDHTVTALYEIIPAGQPVPLEDSDALKYQQPASPSEAARTGEVATVKLRYKLLNSDTSQAIETVVSRSDADIMNLPSDFRFAAAVAEFGMLLRASPHKGQASYDQVIEIASSAELDERRRELIELVKAAKRLSGR